MSFSKKLDAVAKYYNKSTQQYIDSGYGDVIQAHRPPDVNELLQQICINAGIKDGMTILDAGCGICGPAIYIAKHFNVSIKSVTNSSEQVKIAKEKVTTADIKGKIEVILHDFHNLNSLFAAESFDLVIMLESFGHAIDKARVLNGASTVLKKEGHLYIKDYFSKEITGSRERKQGLKKAIKNMNKYYCYNLANLENTIKYLRQQDMEIQYIKNNPLPVEDQSFVRDFEKNNNIDLFEGGFHYLFLEPLELFFKKPSEVDSVIK